MSENLLIFSHSRWLVTKTIMLGRYLIKIEFRHTHNYVFLVFFIFFYVWSILFKNFKFLYFFWRLICFLTLVLFSGQIKIFCLVYSRTKNFMLTRSGQSQVKGLRPCLVCHVFVKGFFLKKDVFGKNLLSLFW